MEGEEFVIQLWSLMTTVDRYFLIKRGTNHKRTF